MRTRIVCYDFGRISDFGCKRYVIEIKRHWWSRWEIRDWSDKNLMTPRFYENVKEALGHL
jgi:hypothetical protein